MMFSQVTDTDKPSFSLTLKSKKVEKINLMWRKIQFFKMKFNKFSHLTLVLWLYAMCS